MRVQLWKLCAALALSISVPSASFAAKEPKPEAVGKMKGGPAVMEWEPSVDHDRLILAVVAPDGEVFQKEFPAGKNPAYRLQDHSGSAVAGTYRYEIRVVPRITGETRRQLEEARKRGDDASIARIQRAAGLDRTTVQSGSFIVANGAFVSPDIEEPGSNTALRSGTNEAGAAGASGSNPRLRPALNDQVIPDDLIVQGSACVGLDCIINEAFAFDTLRFKENNTRIKFEDTSTSAGFATTDWTLSANDSASGGLNKFSLEDTTGALVPFTVEGNSPNNSLYVDSTGNIGFSTATPVLDLHSRTGNTPAVRFEQDSTGGFTAQTWDIGANEANFFVRDVTGGSRLPFRIRPGAPTSSIDIAASGNVGIGSPPTAGVRLEIQGADPGAGSSALGWRISNSNTNNIAAFVANNRAVIGTTNATPLDVITNGSASVRLTVATSGNVGFGVTAPAHPIHHSSGAHLTAGGAWTNASSAALKQDVSALDGAEAISALEALAPVKFAYKTDPAEHHVGFIAEDVPELVATSDRKGLSAMDVVAVLTKVVQEQQKTIVDLNQRLSSLEKSREK